MQDMFTNYDNLDPNYIPVNTHWPKCNCDCPAAVLVTPSITHGDTFSITFKLNEYIVEAYEDKEMSLDVFTFRGEPLVHLVSHISDSFVEFEVDADTYKILVPDIYYVALKLHADEEVYTLYDRSSPCLTIV